MAQTVNAFDPQSIADLNQGVEQYEALLYPEMEKTQKLLQEELIDNPLFQPKVVDRKNYATLIQQRLGALSAQMQTAHSQESLNECVAESNDIVAHLQLYYPNPNKIIDEQTKLLARITLMAESLTHDLEEKDPNDFLQYKLQIETLAIKHYEKYSETVNYLSALTQLMKIKDENEFVKERNALLEKLRADKAYVDPSVVRLHQLTQTVLKQNRVALDLRTTYLPRVSGGWRMAKDFTWVGLGVCIGVAAVALAVAPVTMVVATAAAIGALLYGVVDISKEAAKLIAQPSKPLSTVSATSMKMHRTVHALSTTMTVVGFGLGIAGLATTIAAVAPVIPLALAGAALICGVALGVAIGVRHLYQRYTLSKERKAQLDGKDKFLGEEALLRLQQEVPGSTLQTVKGLSPDKLPTPEKVASDIRQQQPISEDLPAAKVAPNPTAFVETRIANDEPRSGTETPELVSDNSEDENDAAEEGDEEGDGVKPKSKE